MQDIMEGPGYLAVTTQPTDALSEEAFHTWYNEEHGPMRLRLPFIQNGFRYKAIDGQRPTWLAWYDVEDLSHLQKRIYTRLREERSQREKGVISKLESLDRKIYSVVSSRGSVKTPAPVHVAVTMMVNESDLDEFDKWYEDEHIGMLSKIPGWLRSRRFKMVVGGIKGMPPTGQVECLAVHEFEEKNGLGGPEHKAAQDTPWRTKVLDKVVSKDRREFDYYLEFDALEEPPSTVITTDGAELKFQMEGNPADPVIVFVNSILTNFSIWDGVAQELTKPKNGGQSYRVLRYNSRGYSQQAERSNPTSFDILADDLEYLLQRLNIEKVHAVVGVSMGGVTSINFAIRHPDMLEKFVACDCNTASSPANNDAWAQRIELAKTKGIGALADVTAKRWFTERSHSTPEFSKVLEMIEQASVLGFEQSAGALCKYDLKPHLASIKTPGLLIAGDGDGKLPEAMQKFGISSTTFKEIPNAGHLPQLENHEAFMEALRSFLG